MRVRVKSKELNIRKQAEAVGTIYGVLHTDFEFEVESVVEGKPHAPEGEVSSKIWCKDRLGFYYWAGGLRLLEDGSISRKSWKDLLREIQESEATETSPAAPNSLSDIKVPLPWYITDYGIDKIWKQTMGEGVKIAIIDSGIRSNHPDFDGAVDKMDAKNFYRAGEAGFSIEDTCGHGSWCASIAAGRGKKDIVGIAPGAELIIGKVVGNTTDQALESVIIAAIDWAINERKADIVSMSLAFPESEKLVNKFNELKKGVIVVAAGDNNKANGDVICQGCTPFPANQNEVISVSAVGKDKQILGLSRVDTSGKTVFAPGNGFNFPAYSGVFNIPGKAGTSYSTAFLAGVIALGIAPLKKAGLPIDHGKIQAMVFNTGTIIPEINHENNCRVVNVIEFCKKIIKP